MEAKGTNLHRIREHYYSQTTQLIDQLLESYLSIMKAAPVIDSTHARRDNFQVEAHSAALVRNAESLLKLIAELKHSYAINDFPAIRKEADAFASACNIVHQQTDSDIAALRYEVQSGLLELDECMASSRVKTTAPTTPAS